MSKELIPYKWTKIKNGIGSFAIVSLKATPNVSQNKILEHYAGHGFTSQGYIEEVSFDGYCSWKIAARKGLEYAFSLTDAFWTVDIYSLQGMTTTGTNPTIVGYTVLRAFFNKIDHQ